MNHNEEILKKLDILIRVSAVSAIQGKTLKEQVAIMSMASLGPKDIAEILGKRSNHISVVLNNLKKEKGYGNK